MNSPIEMICYKLFPTLRKERYDILCHAYKLNKHHLFNYSCFTVTETMTSGSTGKTHLFPETKAYLDEVLEGGFLERYKQMEQIVDFLTEVSLHLVHSASLYLLVPPSFNQRDHKPIKKDRETIERFKQRPEYELLQTYCLFAGMGAL